MKRQEATSNKGKRIATSNSLITTSKKLVVTREVKLLFGILFVSRLAGECAT